MDSFRLLLQDPLVDNMMKLVFSAATVGANRSSSESSCGHAGKRSIPPEADDMR